MKAHQIQRRQEIMGRLWAVEDKAPGAEGPEVVSAAGVAALKLEQLVGALDESADALEAGKTWRYLGDACFSRSGKTDQRALQQGRRAYLRAEPLLEAAKDQLELAKFNFNLANTLRLIDEAPRRPLMEEAKRRYYKALLIFRQLMPDAVARVESSLQSLEIMLRGLDVYESAEQSLRRLRDLKARLEEAGPNADPEVVRSIHKELEEIKRTEKSPGKATQEVSVLLDQAASLLSPPGRDPKLDAKFQEMRSTLAALSSSLDAEDRQVVDETDELFSRMYAELKTAGGKGEVTQERRDALYAILKEFEKLTKESPETPEGMVTQVGLMRDLVAQNKQIFTDWKL